MSSPQNGNVQPLPADKPFLARTRKYGWIVVEKAPPGWTGYLTRPGKYGVAEKDILDRAPVPPD